ncbi:cation/H(+) antiporter 15 [Prunus yedoensis var. nudiflora]|uniref:Cation/H(+) antiporter 15 n=1 Tax=Prunus yedoensis var. nudiflora TaxID=2094558 RepID=A0A314USU4_PRUYE|nr:cation/H(+) antiporter 15 [Prunus yedoensis var. nudiflora]
MNTKVLLGLIILNSAKDLQVLDHRTFAVMMSAIWLMTVPVGPFLALGYKTTRASTQYKIRNIQSLEPDTELRILTHTYPHLHQRLRRCRPPRGFKSIPTIPDLCLRRPTRGAHRPSFGHAHRASHLQS